MITQSAYINLQEGETMDSHHFLTQGFSNSVPVDLARINILYLFKISWAVKRICFVASAATGTPGRLITFAVVDRVLAGAMFA